jgi:hypothetical protein
MLVIAGFERAKPTYQSKKNESRLQYKLLPLGQAYALVELAG